MRITTSHISHSIDMLANMHSKYVTGIHTAAQKQFTAVSKKVSK